MRGKAVRTFCRPGAGAGRARTVASGHGPDLTVARGW